MSEKEKLSMEEAKKRAGESYGGQTVEATYTHKGLEWPYVYTVPTTGVSIAATKKSLQKNKDGSIARNPDGSVAQDQLVFMVEILVETLADAPFEISRESLLKLNPLIFGQLAEEVAKYLAMGETPKKS